ncbi:MAG: hypothetical protein WC859_00370 [Elusimicrobiota bacterium]|jgi:hypothetical protein
MSFFNGETFLLDDLIYQEKALKEASDLFFSFCHVDFFHRGKSYHVTIVVKNQHLADSQQVKGEFLNLALGQSLKMLEDK